MGEWPARRADVVMGVHKPTGELSWICINSQPLLHPDEKTTQGVVVSFSDITEQKLKEQELKHTLAAVELIKREPQRLSRNAE
jgi:signal transduction histidine kinase